MDTGFPEQTTLKKAYEKGNIFHHFTHRSPMLVDHKTENCINEMSKNWP